MTLHYLTLHYLTLPYMTLYYITLNYLTLHYITCRRYPDFIVVGVALGGAAPEPGALAGALSAAVYHVDRNFRTNPCARRAARRAAPRRAARLLRASPPRRRRFDRR